MSKMWKSLAIYVAIYGITFLLNWRIGVMNAESHPLTTALRCLLWTSIALGLFSAGLNRHR